MKKLLLSVLTVSAIIISPTFAWTGPSALPPSGNVALPINTGSTEQSKTGIIDVYGILINGSSQYVNFGTTTGTTGYGIRNNGGTIEFKNNGGTWQPINTILQTYFASGSTNTVAQIKFADGTTQTTAATAGGIGGTGTANTVPKFTAASTLGNSQITEVSNNVGIGVTGTPGEKLEVNGSLKITGVNNVLYGPGSATTYGALTVRGTKGAYSGINFQDSAGTNYKTLMIHPTYSGVFNSADNAWDWYWNNGSLAGGNVPAARVSPGAFQNGNYSIVSDTSGYPLTVGSTVYYTTPSMAGYFYNADSGVTPTGYVYLAYNSTSGQNYGLYSVGAGQSSIGVYGVGRSPNGIGVQGHMGSGSTYGYGVYGIGNGTGSYGVYCNGTSCGGNKVWTNASDARLKTEIETLKDKDGLPAILKLRPVTYRWRDAGDYKNVGTQYGFIAQEVEPVLPYAVTTNKRPAEVTHADGTIEKVENPKAMSYATVVVPLVKAVQQLKEENNALTEKNKNLEARIERLEALIK